MAAISTGTTCIYGIAGTVANLFVQSYSLLWSAVLHHVKQS